MIVVAGNVVDGAGGRRWCPVRGGARVMVCTGAWLGDGRRGFCRRGCVGCSGGRRWSGAVKAAESVRNGVTASVSVSEKQKKKGSESWSESLEVMCVFVLWYGLPHHGLLSPLLNYVKGSS